MRRFEFSIDDERSDKPVLLTVEVKDLDRARELARMKLAESTHYKGVEVREDGVRLLGVGSFERPRTAEDHQPLDLR